MKRHTKRPLELRAENIKTLQEKRAILLEEIEVVTKTAKAEVRAMSEDEVKKFEDLESQIKAIDQTISIEERARGLEIEKAKTEKSKVASEQENEVEVRAFANYIRGVVEQRADVNLTTSDNGAIIPKSIAKRIIETIKDICPIYSMAEKFNVKGELSFPVYDESTQKITCAYQTEFSEMESSGGKFTSITLKGYLAGALAKVSKSLVNNSDFDLVSYVVKKLAEAISDFLEKELIVGTADKMTGALSTLNLTNAASATVITSDELISLQMKIKKAYQKACRWTMNMKTFEAVRKMKDGQGNYLLIKDAREDEQWKLLGKPVELSDNMPDIATGKKPILYGDYSGVYVKLSENINIEVLRERFATEHVIGVIGWVEADSDIVEPQKIAALKMA